MPAGEELARRLAADVPDPELPFLTLGDLGILRRVEVGLEGTVRVVLTPTYSGCPAVTQMADDVRRTLMDAGFPAVQVDTELAPAWSTDRLGPQARAKMEAMDMAPPPLAASSPISLTLKCPHCGSLRTRELSHFGSTACKSLWRCQDCREPFEHFKALR
ncbi:MAG: 1,2-phenylacetyl-CoA epoxidase subunit PaaD [Candidatus Dormibacteria bacterium]